MAKARDIINIFTCRQSKNTAVDYEQVISEYKEKISSLNSDLDASKKGSEDLHHIIEENKAIIVGLRKDIVKLEGELEQVKINLDKEKSRNNELKEENVIINLSSG